MKYTITGRMTVSCWTEVEAESKEEALKIANERANNDYVAPPEISGTYEVNEYFHFDTDGTPLNLEIEEQP